MYHSSMGRRKTVWPDEPPRFCPRRMPSGKILYYYQAAGGKIPLGADRDNALKEWVKLEKGNVGPRLLPEIAALFRKEVFGHLAASTQDHYETALENLEGVFAAFTLEAIEPKHVKKYIRERSKKGAALFEKRVLSALYAWARGEGHTAAPNPCAGVKFTAAEKRGFEKIGKRMRYVTDAEYDDVYGRADELLRDAMDLALYTGQRPGDILAARRQDIVEGVLWFTQQKTSTRLGIAVEEDFKPVLERILTRPRKVPSMYLIADARGQRVRLGALQRRFAQARGSAVDWQFRDIRAKAATDSPDLKRAQALLGHKNETTTIIYRRQKSNITQPLKRANLEPI